MDRWNQKVFKTLKKNETSGAEALQMLCCHWIIDSLEAEMPVNVNAGSRVSF